MLLSKKLLFYQNMLPKLFTVAGTYNAFLPVGTYKLTISGAGGAGGGKGVTGLQSTNEILYDGAIGGAGGIGERKEFFVRVVAPGFLSVNVGAKGLYATGNGGVGGTRANLGGRGGGGGRPTYITFPAQLELMQYSGWESEGGEVFYSLPGAAQEVGTTVRLYTEDETAGGSASFEFVGNVIVADKQVQLDETVYYRKKELDKYSEAPTYLYAQGGGGGGGGGGGSQQGRYAWAGSGGGGGGYYHFNEDGTITNYAGAVGGNGWAASSSGNGYQGTVGYTAVFGSTAYSGDGGGAGHGTDYNNNRGGAGQPGTGAGGGGGGSAGNHSTTKSGGGGGGAGGSLDAGGGAGARGGYDTTVQATNGYNHHTTPTAGKNHLGETVTSGWGVGGVPSADGSDGWAYITVA